MDRWLIYTQLSSILVLSLAGFARSDFASDRKECANQLVGLAPCLPYSQGEAKAPTADCCSGLKQVISKSKKCLCVLVKDRNEPSLGFKINATLALSLPASCSSPTNISECIGMLMVMMTSIFFIKKKNWLMFNFVGLDLLHLDPNSSEAQVFKQFGSGLEGKNSSSTANAG